MLNIEDLPDEILLHILGYLTIRDLMSLQLTNHRWRQIASDRTFFSSISINENDSNSFINALLSQNKDSIRHLNIVDHSNIDLLAPLVSECCNLETLSIKLCNGSGDQMLRSIECCTRLSAIILQHTPIQRLGELLDILSKKPMKKINIRNMDVDLGADDLSDLHAVEDLRLKSVRVHPIAIYRFCLHNFQCLTTLKLIVSDESWLLSDIDLNETVFKTIGSCLHLKSLCLGPQITSTMNDAGFMQIIKLNSLHTFEIHNAISVSSSAFIYFFGRPSSLKLRKISLYKCPSVDTTVLRKISESCTDLQKFTLEKSKACRSDRDFQDIVQLSQNCRKLRRLSLFSMHIVVAEILHLIPRHLPELVSLKYSNSDKPMKIPSFLPLLQERMPNFEINGMQWTYNLYVDCRRRKPKPTINKSNLVCGKVVKMHCLYR